MVSEENKLGLYISFPVYFLILVGASVWAYNRMGKMKHEGVTDAISAHYLGGRSFGPLITAGTMFASLFSGYTVIGVPNEAFDRGWLSFRWMASGCGIIIGYIGTGLRLRKASLFRNHQSPVDFVTDRFQSQTLRYTIVFLQLIPSIIYVSAQVIALKGTFNALFDLDPDNVIPVIVIFILILIFEWVGGLSSVALTDAIQGMVMLMAFLLVPCIIKANFGGWKELDWETYPEQSFYQNPSASSQWDFWNFAMINVGFFSLPHLLQRTYAAADLKSLKVGYAALSIAPWFTFFVGIFMGTVGVQILSDAGVENPTSPFTAILEQVMESGPFAKVVGVIAFTSSLAAIMSTADSLVIAISQLVTVEIIYPMKPDATPSFISWMGRGVSLIAVTLALLIGIFWQSGISDLGAVQFSLSAMAAPTFLVGLFSTSRTEVHPWNLALGAMSGAVVVISLYFGYLRDNDEALPMHPGVMGLVTHIVVTLVFEFFRNLFMAAPVGDETSKSNTIEVTKRESVSDSKDVELIFKNRPAWDVPALSRFGDGPLTSKMLWRSMEGVKEPLANPWFAFLIFFAVTMMTPIVPAGLPPLNELGKLMWDPGTINGIPHWAFKIVILAIIPTVVFLVMVYEMPNSYPINDAEKIAKEGVDPDLVELTAEEMGRRSSYDERNMLVQKRRSTINKNMKQLGMLKGTNDEQEGQALDNLVERRRLSALVLGNAETTVIPECASDEV